MLRRIAIALVAALLLAAGWRLLARRDARTTGAARAGAKLLTFDDRAITAFTLTSGGTAWRFARSGTGWEAVAPLHDLADAAAVDALLAALRRASVVQTIDPPEALSGYGLAPPQASIAFEGIAVPAIGVGSATPTGDGVFVHIEGRPGVLVVGLPEAAPLVNVTPEAFRDTSWVGAGLSEMRAVTIGGDRAALRVERRPDGWWIVAPRLLPASTAQVERLLGAIASTRVAGVEDAGRPGDPRYGLGRGALRLTVETVAGTRDLALGGDAGGGRRFATNDARQTILIVEGKALASIPTDAASLREPKLTAVNRYAVARMTYAAGGLSFDASRVDEKTWTTRAGGNVPAADVYALLVDLLESRTTGFSEGAPKGAPVATLAYRLDDGREGRVAYFAGNVATWDALPGAVFQTASPPPVVPAQK